MTKYIRHMLFILLASAAILVGFQAKSSCWSLLQLFRDASFSEEGLRKAEEYDPERDLLVLPSLENKTFFESIDDLSICRRKEVRRYLYVYLTQGREYLKTGIRRSGQYLDIVEEVFRENKDIPEEIALLPLLESGFSPYAVSRSRAMGLWQFLPATSGYLGLKINGWVDERRDLEKSTVAAIRHLRNLYGIFRNWELALAAYNGGAGSVKRAMIKTGAKDFWSLAETGALRKETAEYVARYAALLVLYENQELFGIRGEVEHAMPMEMESVVLDYPVPMRDLARVSGLPVETLRKYNPELCRDLTPPMQKYSLKVPPEARKKIEKNKEKLYLYKFTFLKRHVVRKGECLAKIARLYRTRPELLIIFNDIRKPYRLQPGASLYIPI